MFNFNGLTQDLSGEILPTSEILPWFRKPKSKPLIIKSLFDVKVQGYD